MRRSTAALLLLIVAAPAAADLAPGDPPLTQDLADLRRDAVEVVFDVQLTARQLREHQRLYAWCWKYAPRDWQKAERDRLAKFRGVLDKSPADRSALRAKHQAAWKAEADSQAAKGNPYHRWLLTTAREAAETVAADAPALRRDALANLQEFVQWGLRMQLTARQQEEFLRQVPAEWKATPPADRTKILDEFLPVYRRVVRLAPSQRDAVRKVAEPALKEGLAKPETPLDRWLAAAHAEAGRVLADGPPDLLTAGGAAQHADWYDWALGFRLPDDARTAFRDSLVLDWKQHPDQRRGWLNTSALMDDPPAGGVGALRRLEDRAALLFHVTGGADNRVNRAAMAEYRKLHPGVTPPPPPATGKTLIPGEVPLTEGLADGAGRCLEWALGVEFNAAQRIEHRRTLVETWKSGKTPDELRAWERDAFMATQLALLTPEDTALVRAWLRPDVLKRFTESKDADDKWAVAQYHAVDPLLNPADPDGPTRGDLRAFEELLRFRALEVSGGNTAAADKVVAEAVDRVKAEKGVTADVRRAGLQLALVRRAWPGLAETDRQELRDRWAADLRPLGVPVKLAAWQAEPAPSREVQALDALRELQRQQQAVAAASNMLRMQHEARMSVIRNMGSTPYRYEYRYEYRRR